MDEIVLNNAGKDEKGKEVRTLGEMKLDRLLWPSVNQARPCGGKLLPLLLVWF
jgi:hypothetical protein